MSDPTRWLDEKDRADTALRQAVLRAGRSEMPPPSAKEKLVTALLAQAAQPKAPQERLASRLAQRLEKKTMFDAVLNRGTTARSRFGSGAFFSAVVHTAILGMAIYISSRPPEEKKKNVDVTFVQAAPPPAPEDAPPPPPPPPPPKRRSTPKVEKVEVKEPEVVKKPDTLIESTEKAEEKPVDVAQATPSDEGGDDDGVEGGVEGGVKGGVVGGTVGGTIGGTAPPPPPPQPQNTVIPFGAGMNRPSMVAGRDPVYTRDALAAHVEGLMIVRCTITTSGAITNCRVIKELPHMKQAVLDALYSRRYTPVLFNGQPVNVDYVFNIKLVLPSR